MPDAEAENHPAHVPPAGDSDQLATPAAATRGNENSAPTQPGRGEHRRPAGQLDPATAGAETADVWSWTARKYRIRATVLLLLNLLLFCGLCVFTHWLHVLKPFQFELASYLDPLRLWGSQTQNLYDFVLYPISVDQTPIYGVVIGLLLASIVAVPISVAILYRFGCALLFCAAVLVFAHLPWMAVTLVASCILASVRPFRMSFRFGSALVALLPVVLYLYLATRGAAETLSASISPERKLLLTGPWLLAILGACTMLAIIILIARIVHYRPGAVTPVMAIMFATPTILFHTYVGVDELTYRVLEPEYGPRSKRFEPVQDATEEILDLVRRRAAHGIGGTAQSAVLLALSSERPAEQLAAIKHRFSNHLLLNLMEDRQKAYAACKEFIADHPTSRFVPSVLFIQARTLDTRLDELKFSDESVRRELYTDFPHVQSEPVWTSLLTGNPDSPLAVAARLRVAQLRLRRGDAEGALAALGAPQSTPSDDASAETQPAARPFLHTTTPESTLDFEPEPYLFEAERLRELILNNWERTADPDQGVGPLQALAALDRRRQGYQDQLCRLADQYSRTRLYDNLVVRWASAHVERAERVRLLEAYIESADRFPDDDALPEAMFELADVEVQAFGGADEERRGRGIARLHAIVDRFGETCWGKLAAERLRMLDPRPSVTAHVMVAP